MAMATNDCVVSSIRREKVSLTRRNYLLNAYPELPPEAVEEGLHPELEAELPSSWAQLVYKPRRRTLPTSA